jgi:hypothetical protein
MLAFLAHHTELHRILALLREQMQDGTKIRHAREAISKGAGSTYDYTIATLEEQCRTSGTVMAWEPFVAAMVAASLRLPIHSTTGRDALQ